MTTAPRSGTVATLGDMIEARQRLYVVCETHGCGTTREIDLVELAARYGRAQGCLHADLVRLPWRCTTCGGRKVTFRLSPDRHHSPPDPDEPF